MKKKIENRIEVYKIQVRSGHAENLAFNSLVSDLVALARKEEREALSDQVEELPRINLVGGKDHGLYVKLDDVLNLFSPSEKEGRKEE